MPHTHFQISKVNHSILLIPSTKRSGAGGGMPRERGEEDIFI